MKPGQHRDADWQEEHSFRGSIWNCCNKTKQDIKPSSLNDTSLYLPTKAPLTFLLACLPVSFLLAMMESVFPQSTKTTRRSEVTAKCCQTIWESSGQFEAAGSQNSLWWPLNWKCRSMHTTDTHTHLYSELIDWTTAINWRKKIKEPQTKSSIFLFSYRAWSPQSLTE